MDDFTYVPSEGVCTGGRLLRPAVASVLSTLWRWGGILKRSALLHRDEPRLQIVTDEQLVSRTFPFFPSLRHGLQTYMSIGSVKSHNAVNKSSFPHNTTQIPGSIELPL